MITSPIAPNHYIDAYHQTNSLIFQFILIEFIEAFQAIKKLDSLCSRKLGGYQSEHPLSLSSEEISHQIHLTLTTLVGSTRGYMRIFPWNFSEGLLPKLKTYCALLLQNAEADEKEFIAMQHYIDKIYQACLQAIDAFQNVSEDRHFFLNSIDKASNGMLRFAKLISRVIQQFRDDENVIFFILRHEKQLDKLYGNRFIAKLFARLYPRGITEAKLFLQSRYRLRGFENIAPIISFQIAELEASLL